MAAAQMKKAALLEDQNMLLLMTMPDDRITTSKARSTCVFVEATN